ncbi:MAG: tetratricopeptide repeat protein, partial [candidate division Zixibacteria bacterium]
EFTVEGYALFSLAHILDFVNLLFMLTPGLLIWLATVPRRKTTSRNDDRGLVSFLVILSIAGALIAFLFDPHLGMPRDWDLFAFCGIPIAVLIWYDLLNLSARADQLRIGAMIVGLSLICLLPRVIFAADSDIGLSRYEYVLSVDRSKNRNARQLLAKLHRSAGNDAKADAAKRAYLRDYPERQIILSAVETGEKTGNWMASIVQLRRALEINPVYSDIHFNMGYCFFKLGQLDSALVRLQVAKAINPYSARIHNMLGNVHSAMGDQDAAIKFLRQAAFLDNELYSPPITLANIYISRGNIEEASNCLDRMISLEGTVAEGFKMVGDNFLAKGKLDLAGKAFSEGLKRGLDRDYVKRLQTAYPQLQVSE